MKTKMILVALLVAGMCGMGVSASAQTRDFRDPGFAGSISLTNRLGVFVGTDFSFGYMLDRQNYLGLGVGGFLLPKSDGIPLYGTVFADYRHYFKDAGSSLFAGSRLGYSRAFNYGSDHGVTYRDGVFFEPNLGWSWTLKSGYGLELGAGATLIFPVGESRTSSKVLALPKVSFGFVF